MPYCPSSLVVEPDADVRQTISLLSQEQFNARDAYELDHAQYNIDAGMNDVRAVLREGEREIRICCRFEEDVQRTERKLLAFAKVHTDLCSLSGEH